MRAAKMPSVHELLMSIRLKKAEHFLRYSIYTVKDEARMTGWSSSLYFSNCFRRRYGCPPGVYRLRIERELAASERRALSDSTSDGGISVKQTP
ncbi:MAG: helix-turn-helix domain-containing protein, partial [Lentisphaeria bacterium]|nr:helix-turn-helix domain-containing protein [Lentisphaeria bacterium]